MNLKKLLIGLVAASFSTLTLAQGDAKAGKETFEASCSSCHYEDDFNDEADSVLEPLLKAILNKEIRHRSGFQGLTEEDVANLAAYLATQ